MVEPGTRWGGCWSQCCHRHRHRLL